MQGELLKLMEVAFSRILGYDGQRYTAIDRTLVFVEAEDFSGRRIQDTSSTSATFWRKAATRMSVGDIGDHTANNIEGILHGKVVSRDLLNDATPPPPA